MNRESIQDHIERIYAARLRNDGAAMKALFSDDARFGILGQGSTQTLATMTPGPDAIAGVVDELIGSFEWHELDMHRMTINGPDVATLYTVEVTHLPTGERVRTQVSDHLTLHEGMIVFFAQFVDTGLVSSLDTKAKAY
jgi:ketosteroid isomerase-like protein